MKKILLSLGTIATIATPVAVVVSCGDGDSGISLAQQKVNAKTKLGTLSSDEKKRIESAKTPSDIKDAVSRINADRKEILVRDAKATIKGILDKNLINNMKTIITELGKIPNIKKGPLAIIFEADDILEFATDALEHGIKHAMGSVNGFDAKVKKVFDIDISKSLYAPLIKGALYGYDNNLTLLDKLDKIPKPKVQMGSIEMEVNIYQFIKDITEHGFVYAVHNSSFYGNAIVRSSIDKLPGFDKGDPDHGTKFNKYYGDAIVTTAAGGVTTVTGTGTGIIGKIFKKGFFNINSADHSALQSFLGDISESGILPVIKTALAMISVPGSVSLMDKILPLTTRVLKNINSLSDKPNTEVPSLIHKLITKGISSVTQPEFTQLFSLIKTIAGSSTKIEPIDTQAGIAMHKLFLSTTKIGDMTVSELTSIATVLINPLERLFPDSLPELLFTAQGAIKAAAAVYSGTTDTISSLLNLVMILVAKYI
ncbi:MAG: hypothetical protein KAG91_01320 [Mycoplasmataceae bacterium]|nr:hypothetical protein [Mycoplasmataceae bacterium]